MVAGRRTDKGTAKRVGDCMRKIGTKMQMQCNVVAVLRANCFSQPILVRQVSASPTELRLSRRTTPAPLIAVLGGVRDSPPPPFSCVFRA